MNQFWMSMKGSDLAQGDLLDGCLVPSFGPGFGGPGSTEMLVEEGRRLVVMTQSCDLETKRVRFVALCLIHSLPEYELANPHFRRKGHWEQVRKGRVEGCTYLLRPQAPRVIGRL